MTVTLHADTISKRYQEHGQRVERHLGRDDVFIRVNDGIVFIARSFDGLSMGLTPHEEEMAGELIAHTDLTNVRKLAKLKEAILPLLASHDRQIVSDLFDGVDLADVQVVRP